MLAFRLAGLPTGHPGIATQKDLVTVSLASVGYSWAAKKLSSEDRLKYFKSESWGTASIYVSKGETKRRTKSRQSVVKSIRKAVSKFETIPSIDENSFTAKFVNEMLRDPEWCGEAMKQYTAYTVEIYNLLKKTLSVIERAGGRT